MNADGWPSTKRKKAALKLLDELPGLAEIPFDELAVHGIVLDPCSPLPPCPAMKRLVSISLTARIELYDELDELDLKRWALESELEEAIKSLRNHIEEARASLQNCILELPFHETN